MCAGSGEAFGKRLSEQSEHEKMNKYSVQNEYSVHSAIANMERKPNPRINVLFFDSVHTY